ncbi:hypothetical protein LTR37_001245 [Vermiconidia calcicola]|uniref:Uncharacterized protein n=1 Tax=Vermiconidia calcicola TaxID=1690605 RepID=A0ACC3NWH9_9PEZI|nr:hypothetical protein LTR37_001245 [Vermiconidia calcicola]
MATNAAAKCFAVPELFDMIFLHLPMENLFVAQGISSTFRDAINTSRQLRRIMWLEKPLDYEPDDSALNPLCNSSTQSGTLNPLSIQLRCFDPTYNATGGLIGFECLLIGTLHMSPRDVRLQSRPYQKLGSWRDTLVQSSPYRILLQPSMGVHGHTLQLTSDTTLGKIVDMLDDELEKVLEPAM